MSENIFTRAKAAADTAAAAISGRRTLRLLTAHIARGQKVDDFVAPTATVATPANVRAALAVEQRRAVFADAPENDAPASRQVERRSARQAADERTAEQRRNALTARSAANADRRREKAKLAAFEAAWRSAADAAELNVEAA